MKYQPKPAEKNMLSTQVKHMKPLTDLWLFRQVLAENEAKKAENFYLLKTSVQESVAI